MKKLSLFPLLFLTINLFGQEDCSREGRIASFENSVHSTLGDIIKKTENERSRIYGNDSQAEKLVPLFNKSDDSEKKGFLISQPTLEKYRANQIAFFVSNSDELSFYKAQATYEAKDNKFTFQTNFPLPDKSDKVYGIGTLGLQGDINSGVTSIFSSSTFNNNIGVRGDLKVVWKRGTIYFFQSSSKKMNDYRKYLQGHLTHKSTEEIKKYYTESGQFRDYCSVDGSIRKKMAGSAEETFYAMELKEAADNHINASKGLWVGIHGYLPLGNTRYLMTQSVNSESQPIISPQLFKKWDFGADFNYYWWSKRRISQLYTFGFKVINMNNIILQEDFGFDNFELLKFTKSANSESYSFTDTSQVNRKIVTSISKEGKDSTIYQGAYKSYTRLTLSPSVLFSPSFFKKIPLKGLRLFANLDLQENLNYREIGFGLPFSFATGDEKKINLELLTTLRDLGNNFGTYKKYERVNISINVGLPLTGFFESR